MADDSPTEHSSLLSHPSPTTKQEDIDFDVLHDLAGLARQTIPICLSFALQNAVQAISVVTAGSLGSFELEVTSFGFMFFSCTGTMVAIGGATALDTLCAQAAASHAVSNDPKILGLLLQQCLLVLLGIFGLLIAPIWLISGHIFIALGQQHDFALATARFMLFMLPSGFLQVVAECLKKFVQVQGESNVVGWSTAAASVLGVLVNFFLVRWTRLGLWGVPCAFCIYQGFTVVTLLTVIACKPAIKKTWYGSVVGVAKGASRLAFYAVTGILTIATEWWRLVQGTFLCSHPR